jgi:hypothetical protein
MTWCLIRRISDAPLSVLKGHQDFIRREGMSQAQALTRLGGYGMSQRPRNSCYKKVTLRKSTRLSFRVTVPWSLPGKCFIFLKDQSDHQLDTPEDWTLLVEFGTVAPVGRQWY